MADKSSLERLQPALLDRLTDLEPEKTTEARDARVIDIRRLREIIRRDLSWLLNTNNLDTQVDPDLYPNVATSVVNYGVREVSGDFATNRRAQDIRASIRRAIELYEPRLRDGSLEIILREEDQMQTTMVVFDIHAEMWADPMPVELYLRSEVDFTTGELTLENQI